MQCFIWQVLTEVEVFLKSLVLFRRWLRVKWWRTIILLRVGGVWWPSPVCTHKTLYSAASASSSTRKMRNHGSCTSDASTAAWWEHHSLLLDKCIIFWNMILIICHVCQFEGEEFVDSIKGFSTVRKEHTMFTDTNLWPSSHLISTFSKHHLRTELFWWIQNSSGTRTWRNWIIQQTKK